MNKADYEKDLAKRQSEHRTRVKQLSQTNEQKEQEFKPCLQLDEDPWCYAYLSDWAILSNTHSPQMPKVQR